MSNKFAEIYDLDEVKSVSLLLEISKIFNRSDSLKEAIAPVLKCMSNKLGLISCTISILDKEKDSLWIEEAIGLTDEQLSKGKYKKGEGILGKVASSGEPAIIPKISKEPDFLWRTSSKHQLEDNEISYISVPIIIENKVIGTLNGDKVYNKHDSLDIVCKIFSIIASMISRAVKHRLRLQKEKEKLEAENALLHQELYERFKHTMLVGNSKIMQTVYLQIQQVCKSPTTVLINGESGTGKELVANAIHYNSDRADKPFVKINCAALPDNLIESELFGHEKGAYTGAISRRLGRFELANKGTLFLDEIGDLSLSVQVKLLRFLQEREFERVGGFETIKADVRIIAATHKNLEELIKENLFRPDLFYRLNVYPMYLPPLRDRTTDIPMLADAFVEKYSKSLNKEVLRISTPAIDMLMSYHWPGNVRELENCIERAVLVTDDKVIHSHHLPPTLQSAEASDTKFKGSLMSSIDKVEREYIIDALKTSGGNIAAAARLLGITQRKMNLRIDKHKINPKEYSTKK